jgi:hypothetical protein
MSMSDVLKSFWENREEPHGCTSQKTAFFTIPAVKTSKLT